MYQYVGIVFLLSHLQSCASSPGSQEKKPEEERLARKAECHDDMAALQQICGLTEADLDNNWVVLDCIDHLPAEKRLSDSCENTVWNFKVEITKKDHFLSQAKEICPQDDISKCDHEKESEPGFLLACLVGKKHETKNLQCGKFLAQVENIIFSDYRIISSFLTACQADVDNLKCGRSRGVEGQRHSQGGTIQCLSEHMEQVSSQQCRQEIQAVVEIQGDDFHLDRALYLACKEDREKFCGRVQAGEGRVYRCLIKYKQSASQQCQEQLTRRQRLVSNDFKADGGLVRSCKTEIKKYSCRQEVDKESKHAVKLSQILICLEAHIRDGEEVSGECRTELGEIRREMMEDFSVSPEIVTSCASEIESHCGNTKRRQGGTIHCLMKLITEAGEEKVVGEKCEAAVDLLLRQSQVMSDWKADPVLEDACDEVVVAACDPKQGGMAVMTCLMEQLSQGGPAMTTECSQVLMQIHYFLAREIIIDDHLYRACNKDAVRMCGGAKNWHMTNEDQKNLLVFPCLVRNLYPEEEDDLDDEKDLPDGDDPSKLSEECVEEVERTLRQRAMSVNLHPDIEENCRDFLHTYCSAHKKPGEELGCLQEHFNNLELECKKTVEQFTQIEARNPYLHPIISKACSNLIDKKCGLEDKARDGSGVMECLVRHKIDHPAGSKGAMNSKCRTVVEQWQILTLQDWRFSFSFKEACKTDIKDHCHNPRPTKKQDVIQCLVEAVASDAVDDVKHRISKDCRAELKFELLQKHSNIKLDPALESACNEDLKNLCQFDRGEDGGIECLKSQKHKDLTKSCRKQLFKEEKEEANYNEVDFVLTRSCKREIKEHCPTETSRNILRCLKDFSEDNNFEEKCLEIINKRIVQQSRDFRLNPSLQKSCKDDINKLCSSVLRDYNGDDEFLEGKVLDCLRQSALQKHKLTKKCMKEVMVTAEDAARLVGADPLLEDLCPRSLATCRTTARDDGEITECLKELFKAGAILDTDGQNCNRHIAQTIEVVGADIHADPVLHSACAVDLRKFCRDVPPGEGRIFSCLVAASKEANLALEPECHSVLSNRMEMFGKAVKVAPIDSAQALYDSVLKSPHKNFLLSFVSFFIGVIFMFGICFGRVTKRLRTELKNK